MERELTLSERMTTVTRLLDQVSLATGVRMRATPAAANVPLAVYAKQQKAGTLLGKLTHLGLSWSHANGWWTLGRSSAEEMRERAYREKLSVYARRGLDSQTAQFQKWAASSWAELARDRQDKERRMADLERHQPQGWELRRAELGAELAVQPEKDDFPAYVLGLLLTSHPGALKVLQSGKPVLASTRVPDWNFPLGAAAVKAYEEFAGVQDTQVVVLAARWIQASGRLEVTAGG
ncbi:MAG TPA: hypothetical protein VEX38_04930, partial [Fimbriimonadaceae bacterium]|nr:hypothetical protein [Fimbriimonadaceae bacterium]